MDRYRVTIDGQSYILTGDHPPSEAEARAAIAAMEPSQPSIAKSAAAPNSALSDLEDVGIGALKGAGSSIAGIGDLMTKAGMIPGSTPALPNPLIQRAQQLTTATNTPQTIGKVGEQVAEAAIPAYQTGRAALTALRAAPEIVGDIASHTPVIGPYVRMARTLTKYLPQEAETAAPEAASLPAKFTGTGASFPRIVSAQPVNPEGFSLQVASPSRAAALEAAAPIDRPVGQPSPNAFVRVKPINPADMPREWHAFLDPAAREAADPVELRQAGALHRDVANADQSYRAITGPTAAALRATPPSVWESLLADLARKSGS